MKEFTCQKKFSELLINLEQATILEKLLLPHSPYSFLSSEAVGKSSLISTFVSRYFSEIVPGLMTRVRLPPSPDNSCVTTIVDSQGADAALIAAVSAMSMSSPSSDSLAALLEHAEPTTSRSQSQNMAGIENIDSIVLVYDLDRAETFFRLENHWLPLIERCYNGKVRIRPVTLANYMTDPMDNNSPHFRFP